MKTIIILLFSIMSVIGHSQKITVVKFDKQNITVVPPLIIEADSITVNSIVDNGENVTVNIRVGTYDRSLILWEGEFYKKYSDWNDEMIEARIEELLSIQK